MSIIPRMINEGMHYVQRGILPEMDMLPKTGVPLLIISNHTFSANQLPTLGVIHNNRKDLSVVCNAGFSPYLELCGLDTIPVKSIKHKTDMNIVRNLWSKLIILSGKIAGTTENAKQGILLTNTIADRLASGGSVWLTPAGKRESAHAQVPWKKGANYVLKECMNNNIDPFVAMIYISHLTQSNVLTVNKASELTNLQVLRSDVSLQQHYWEIVSKIS